jgi:dienelactone hydrolase
MPIVVRCGGCGQKYRLADDVAGQSVVCKICNTVIDAPASSAESRREAAWTDLPEVRPVDAAGDRGVHTVTRFDARRPVAQGNRSLLLILGIVAGGAVLAIAVLVVVLVARRPTDDRGGTEQAAGQTKSGNAARRAAGDHAGAGLIPNRANREGVDKLLAGVPLPAFPPLPKPRLMDRSGVRIAFVDFATDRANGNGPGQRMTLRIYYPPGEYQEKTLGCILVAPGETNWLHGLNVDARSYHAETLRYVLFYRFLVVYYSLDGPLENWNKATDAERIAAYTRFKAARAGLVNGRNALQYVLKHVPEVDPDRIYCAGHASAGTLALLLAAHEPRIRACIAYAPVTDLELQLKAVADDGRQRGMLPGLRDFLHDYSPLTHAGRIHCPVFLFHARDDRVIPFESMRRFVSLMNEQKKELKVDIVLRGGYYHAMIHPGMSHAMKWLLDLQRERDARRFNPRPRIVRLPEPVGEPRRVLRYRVQINVGEGADPTPYIRRALRDVEWIDLDKVTYDARSREIVIPFSGRRSIGDAGKALMKARIPIRGTSTGYEQLF